MPCVKSLSLRNVRWIHGKRHTGRDGSRGSTERGRMFVAILQSGGKGGTRTLDPGIMSAVL